MAIVSVIALSIFYRRAAVFFAGLIVTGIPGILKLPLPQYNKICSSFHLFLSAMEFCILLQALIRSYGDNKDVNIFLT
jgi:hypothetical protein